jgi:PPK2 family polyphosphate:nucleotide phosphotransferase
VAEAFAPFIVPPGAGVRLSHRDPSGRPVAPGDREKTEAQLPDQVARLGELQRLWAEGKRSVLIVLQGVDAAGKDGTIAHVFHAFNPQGVTVSAFGPPTAEELQHDFLWRIHPHCPADGHIAIFNRSHYEDVLAVRVHSLVPEPVWRRRYDDINAFERLLSDDAGTRVLKLLLHISSDEQERRLTERAERPDKRWKLHAADLAEEPHYPEYQEAFSEMLERTSTDVAPWFVIPSDHKWYRNWAVAHVLIQVLEEMDPQYPTAPPAGDQAPGG